MTYINIDPITNEPSYYEEGETPPPGSVCIGKAKRKDRAAHLRDWLSGQIATPTGLKSRRELLSVARWCTAIEFAPESFNRFLSGKRSLPEPHLSNLITIAEGFGYKPLDNEHHFL